MKLRFVLALGLASIFSADWVVAEQFLLLSGLPNEILLMRFVSLIYFAFFFFLCYMQFKLSVPPSRDSGKQTKNPGVSPDCSRGFARINSKMMKFLLASCVLTFLAYTVGFGIFIGSLYAPHILDLGDNTLALPTLMLLKAPFAPLCTSLVCGFLTLGREVLKTTTFVGMFGAFVFYSLVKWILYENIFPVFALMVFGFALFCASFLCTIIGVRTLVSPSKVVAVVRTSTSLSSSSAEKKELGSLSGDLLVNRSDTQLPWTGWPFRIVVSRQFLATVVIVGIMLGFLKNNVESSSFTPILLLPGIFLFIVLLSGLLKNIRVKDMITVAVLLASSGILLQPLFLHIVPELVEIPLWLGLALFETAAWLLAVLCARNCLQPLIAAAVSCLAIMTGHCIGTGIVVASERFYQGSFDALYASSLIIMFFYVVLLVLLSHKQQTDSPLLNPQVRWRDSSLPRFCLLRKTQHFFCKGEVPGIRVGRKITSEPECRDSEDASEDALYWHAPVGQIANSYGLTKREQEVLEYLARGRTISYMEESFVLSRNTLKMHIRHIYTKLDVHSKQDVIDLVEQVRKTQRGETARESMQDKRMADRAK